MSVFRIPLWRRFTRIGSEWAATRLTLVEVDGIRMYVSHETAAQLRPEVIRSHLIGREWKHADVVAPSVEEAVRSFLRDWDGAKIGARGTRESAALWINLEKPILAFPVCPHMGEPPRKNSDGEFLCGGEGPDGWPSILDGYDGCEHEKGEWNCPISRFFEALTGAPQRGSIVGGVMYRVIHHEDVLPPHIEGVDKPLPMPPEATTDSLLAVPLAASGWRATSFVCRKCGGAAVLHPYTNWIWGCRACSAVTLTPSVFFKRAGGA